MKYNFRPCGMPLLIGSLPVDDHRTAINIVLEHTPEIPLWVQLPCHKNEGMISQFLPGLPGLTEEDDKIFINTSGRHFDDNLVEFYEEYISVIEGKKEFDDSRFALSPDVAKGFFVFIEKIMGLSVKPVAVKGQITGPLTLATSVKDQDGKAVYYNEDMRDAVVKLVAMKARWQVRQLAKLGVPVIIFFDEPSFAGLGSSAFIGISMQEIEGFLEEVIDAVHQEGALAGIHVCSNADWSVLFESSVDIISFDAYSYFDKFILYSDLLKDYINSGRLIAWGIVPTSQAEDIEKASAESLAENWKNKVGKLESLGFKLSDILAQSFITPSCGTGSLSLDNTAKVLNLAKHVSQILRKEISIKL
ncbi:hypothetical protein [Desulfobacterium sp. N47]|uniref:Cobalamin-independent methionine synthase MetE C-terminal/archaeal domain-containing protein n=1 Tax=uncultured Desulfobacterium sp. TaxID=201089 RepID=E1Y969_9BACT|nr:hypothetical protein N47_A11420 [uncultured Desulfobacterium sp.]